MSKMLFVPALAALAIAGAAQADMVSYTSANFSGGASLTAQVPQFDPTLGALTGVSLQFNGSVQPIAEILNFSGGAVVADSFTNTTGVNPLGGAPLSHTPMVLSDPYGGSTSIDYATVFFGVVAPLAGLNQYTNPADAVAAMLTSTVPGGSLGGFVGLGTNPVAYGTSGNVNDGGTEYVGGAPVFFGGDRSENGTVTVTYTYTPTSNLPAPGSASGLMGLGLLAARRRRR